MFTRRLYTTLLSPDIPSPFLGCHIIALDKSLRVRPVGVCEVVQCIVVKAALYVIQNDIKAAAGPHQLCAGYIAGTEAVVHAVRSVFNHNDGDSILLVDATNAFISLNRSIALYSIQQLCQPYPLVLLTFIILLLLCLFLVTPYFQRSKPHRVTPWPLQLDLL